MFRFITFAFILTHSVAAQAGGLSGSIRLETEKWVVTHRAQTEVDGLPVAVSLEVAQNSLGIQDAMVGADTLVPFVTPARRAFRITIVAAHNPRVNTRYNVQPRNVSIDGTLRLAYVSELDPSRDFQFVVTNQEDGSMLVSYRRRLATGETASGQLVLAPMQ